MKASHEHVKNLFSLIHDGFFSNAFEALSACILTVLVKKNYLAILMTSVFKGKKTFKRKLNIFFFIVCTDGSSISHGGISYQRTGSGKYRSSSGALVPGSAMGAIFSSKFSNTSLILFFYF